MTALADNRDTPRRDDNLLSLPVVAADIIYAGALVALDTSGNAQPAAAAANLVAVGRAVEKVDNSSGSAGDLNVEVRQGVFKFANADTIAAANVGDPAFIVDDQTVAKVSSDGARSRAGTIMGVDSDGVWVAVGLTNRPVPYYLTVTIADISSADQVYVAVPIAGLVTNIRSVIDAAITDADAALTTKIGGVAITGGGGTVANAGSAAGDVDSATPTAANAVAAGDALEVETDGGSTSTAKVTVTFEITPY